MAKLNEINLRKKRVILRTDFDVPVHDGRIIDDFRIQSSLATIKLLLKNKASIMILSHLGRPDGIYIPGLSLRPVAEYLATVFKHIPLSFTDELISMQVRQKMAHIRSGEILVLGNTRFMREEENDNERFAAEIARYGEIYINDAFAVCHREQASVHAITQFLPSYPGLMLESELAHLNKLLTEGTNRPYIAIIGGAKIKDKITALGNLLPKIDKVLVGGAMANTFLRAAGNKVGQSVFDQGQLYYAERLLNQFSNKIVLPTDYVSDIDDDEKFRILDIGQETINNYKQIISQAKTVFWTGDMGVAERHEYARGTQEVAQAIKASGAYSVLAGGDTISAVRNWQMDAGFDYISSGGGATLAYLAGEKLPGLVALKLQ